MFGIQKSTCGEGFLEKCICRQNSGLFRIIFGSLNQWFFLRFRVEVVESQSHFFKCVVTQNCMTAVARH